MRSAKQIRDEHRAVRAMMDELMREGEAAGNHGPLPENEQLYTRLYGIKQTLEWVYPSLIKTTARKYAERRTELAGYRHYVAGPLHATLYP